MTKKFENPIKYIIYLIMQKKTIGKMSEIEKCLLKKFQYHCNYSKDVWPSLKIFE